jgi:hypothetical protein
MPSRHTRRQRGGGPSQQKVAELTAAVNAAAEQQAKGDNDVYNKLKFIDHQVEYEGSILMKSLASATGISGRRPVHFNPTAPEGLKLEVDINPGMMSGKYNYTIRGDTGDTLALALQKAQSWNLDKGTLSLASVATGAARVALLPVTLPIALVGAAAGAVAGTVAGVGQVASLATTGQFIRNADGKVVNPVNRGLGVTGAVAQYAPTVTGRNKTNIISRGTPAPSAPAPAKKSMFSGLTSMFSSKKGGRSTRRRSHH